MTVEVPEFKKCCLCLPLRAGLLGWGYFKVVANAIITLILAYFILTSLLMSLYASNKTYIFPIMFLFALFFILFLLFLTDFVATIVFIIAGHKKNVKVIRGYYTYNIVVLIVTILLIVGAVGLAISRGISSNKTMYSILFSAYLVTIIVQVYFILLLRSEVIKLENSGEFRFVNNSAEAQCMMVSKEKGRETETV